VRPALARRAGRTTLAREAAFIRHEGDIALAMVTGPPLLSWVRGKTARALRPPRRDLRGQQPAVRDDRLLGGCGRAHPVERARGDPDRTRT
jgi:hypothetical protein